ncbi:PAS domain S-box protein [Novosphingobium sp. 1949]|uniref:PAS domain S-box protein n=1 Tax=Novosphingobium organovorum TaxID=2930092 RepID=A0ABT0BDT7_9SPHN|nr:PAS domain S-box protein [Novosphingobium organovorum]MCJ2183206.1 PAS domain S-box protein [Novosphingobium organovorum]
MTAGEGRVGDMADALEGDWSIASRLAAINSSFCLLEMAPDGSILHANRNFLQLMGYTLRQLKGQSHRGLCFEDYAQSGEYAEFWSRLRSGRFVDQVHRRRKADGSVVWFQAVYVPVLSPQGEVRRILKVAIDVTLAQALKAESESKLKALAQTNGIAEFALDGTVLAVNETFLRLFGYAGDEADAVIGRHHTLFCAPDYAASAEYARFWEILRSGRHHSGIYRRVSREGESLWISASYNPICDSDGQVERILKFAQDITSTFEDNLQHVQQIDALSSVQPVVTFDVDGVIRDASARFLAVAGVRTRQILGRRIEQVFALDRLIAARGAHWWGALVEGEGLTGKLALRAPPGEREGPVLTASFHPIRNADGRTVSVVMVGQAGPVADAVRHEAPDEARVQIG